MGVSHSLQIVSAALSRLWMAVFCAGLAVAGCGGESVTSDSVAATGTGPADTGVDTAAPPALAFPSAFRFGAACAAHQVEGGQTNSWTWWETLPQLEDHTVEPSGMAVDHYNRFEEDLDLAQSMGLDTFRFSIEWSRIEPVRGQYDEDEIAHYRAVFEALKARGITPSVTLHHFTEPQWFSDLTKASEPFNDSFCPDGPSDTDFCYWTNSEAPAVFADFCGKMAAEFGEYADEWMTINELTGYWLAAAVSGEFPPGLTANTLEDMDEVALPVLRALLEAHAACYHAIHASDSVDADGDGEMARVGFTTGTGMARPADPGNDKDVEAARQAESLATYLAFDAAITGMLDADFDTVPEEHHPEWENTVDLLGLQYYASTVVVGEQVHPALWGVPCTNIDDDMLLAVQRAAGCPPPPTLDFPLGDEEPPVVFGRQHDPEGLLEVMKLLDQRYPGIPIVITEHGVADYDGKRAGSIVRHLEACHKALEEGIPLEGYYHWSIMDNFEWGRGGAVRFGLFSVDYENDFARAPTVAAEVYGQIAAERGITKDLLDRWGGTEPLGEAEERE